jgi:hypothetical protein
MSIIIIILIGFVAVYVDGRYVTHQISGIGNWNLFGNHGGPAAAADHDGTPINQAGKVGVK